MRTAAKWLLCMALFEPNLSQAQNYSSREMVAVILNANVEKAQEQIARAIISGVLYDLPAEELQKRVQEIQEKNRLPITDKMENIYLFKKNFSKTFSPSIQYLLGEDLEFKKTADRFKNNAKEELRGFDPILQESFYNEAMDFLADLIAVKILLKRFHAYSDLSKLHHETLRHMTQEILEISKKTQKQLDFLKSKALSPGVIEIVIKTFFDSIGLKKGESYIEAIRVQSVELLAKNQYEDYITNRQILKREQPYCTGLFN